MAAHEHWTRHLAVPAGGALPQTQIIEAVRDAIATAQTQPATVPELPANWISKADKALSEDDASAVMNVGVDLVVAHDGYRASWDHWPWLDTLREVTRAERALRNAKQILEYGEPDRAVSYYCRFANTSAEAAKTALGID
ncbi:TPA: hypothetical protein ACKP9S_003573 [Pseudomonas aeruginosa]